MGKRGAYPEKQSEVVTRTPFVCRVGSVFLTLAGVLVILYGALLVGARLGGGAYMLEEYFADTIDVPLSIGRMRMQPNLGLILEEIRMMDATSGKNGIVIDKAVVTWSLIDFIRPGYQALKRIELSGFF